MDPSRCATVDAPLSGGASTRTRGARSRGGRAWIRSSAQERQSAPHADRLVTLARSLLAPARVSSVPSLIKWAARSARLAPKRATSRPRATVTAILGFSSRSAPSRCGAASPEYEPIVAHIGRLDGQNGAYLIRHAIFYALAHGAQFKLFGSSLAPGDRWPLLASRALPQRPPRRRPGTAVQSPARAPGLCGVGSAGDARACLSRGG